MLCDRRWPLIATAMLLGVVACGGQGPALDDDVVAAMRAEIEDVAEDPPAGGAVALIDTPAERHVLAAGEADVAEGRELSGDEAFHVASVTKMITATVALQLVEEGKIALDAPVADLEPDAMSRFEHGDEITLRHLLSHEAGLPEYLTTRTFEADHTALVSVEDGPQVAVLETTCEPIDELSYAAQQRPSFEPGTDGQYTNTNFVVAGRVIEAVTGQSLDAAYSERILEPLELEGTWVPCAQEPRGALARGYDYSAVRGFPDLEADILDISAYQDPIASGATGLVSTADDLVVFTRALLAGELFDDEATLDTMLEPGLLGAGTDDLYGLGVGLQGDVIGHDGVTFGYTTFVRYHEPTDTVVVVLTNAIAHGGTPAAISAGRALVDILADATE